MSRSDNSEIKPKIFNRQLSWDGIVAICGIVFFVCPLLVWAGWYSSKVDSKLEMHTKQIESILIMQGEIQKTQSETSQQIAALLQAVFDRGGYSRKSAVIGAPRQQDNN